MRTFCLSVVADLTEIMYRTFFCSTVFVSICVFNMWAKTTLLLQCGPEMPKGWTSLVSVIEKLEWKMYS